MASPSNIDKIIERQAKFWEVRSRLAEEGGEAARRALAHLAEGPWITVSKQRGCGSRELAERLAEALHWQAFDKEIVAAIARHTRSREKILSRLDEHAIGSLNDYLAQLVVPGSPGQAAYLTEMARVVWGLARKGNAIIVGRGANYFLDPRYGLRVRLIAPLEDRVARIMSREKLSEKQARVVIARDDEAQAGFIRQVFGRDIHDPLGFDLVMNLGGLRTDVAVETILSALRSKLQARP